MRPLRYEDYLGELPQLGADPRQAQFLESAQGGSGYQRVKLDHRLGKVEVANVGRGWWASAPDLEFLQNGAEKLMSAGRLQPWSKKQFSQFVSWAVQRVIRVTISGEPGKVGVNFWTRDDHEVYEYGFSATTNR